MSIWPTIIYPCTEKYPSVDLAVRQVGDFNIEIDKIVLKPRYQAQLPIYHQVVLHPEFYKPGVFNDVAVLLLNQAADTTQPHIGECDFLPPSLVA